MKPHTALAPHEVHTHTALAILAGRILPRHAPLPTCASCGLRRPRIAGRGTACGYSLAPPTVQ